MKDDMILEGDWMGT